MTPEQQSQFVFTAAHQADAERLWRENAERQEQKRRRIEVLGRKHLHPAVWKEMRHEDRQEFDDMAKYYEEHAKISMKHLCGTSLMPGKAGASGGVHAYLHAQLQLARFAKGVHVVSEEKSNRVLDFLTNLQDNSMVPDDVRQASVDVCDIFREIMNAIDLPVHVPSVRMDNV
jgi:hypothetical protein